MNLDWGVNDTTTNWRPAIMVWTRRPGCGPHRHSQRILTFGRHVSAPRVAATMKIEAMNDSVRSPSMLAHGALRVPEINAWFWIVKGLSTAMGEATSDYLVRELHPVPAVLLGFAGFSGALTRRTYLAWSYWLTAVTFHLGYAKSIVLFAGIIAIPIIGYWRLGWHPILAFWFAYVVTRPIGATVPDWTVKPTSAGGLAWPEGPICVQLTLAIAAVVTYLAITGADHQQRPVIGTEPA